MSQQHGKGSDRNRKNMAVSYSSNLSSSRNQTLPSFRELLPPHLHEEIDSAAYYAQSRDRNSESRSAPGPPQRGQPLPPPSGNSRHLHPSGRSASGAASAYPPRGPSPLLPPLRDLQSASGRHLERPMSAYGHSPRSAAHSQEAPYGARTSVEDDQFRSAPYGSGPGTPPAMYAQNAYDSARYAHYASSYASESEYSPMTHNHTLPASTFGVIGDPLDSRGKRRRGNLPKPVTDILRDWFHQHLDHPYPTEEDKQIFMSRTGLSISQISNWFINARRRQLPALRNRIRNSDGDQHHRAGSPDSDGEQDISSPASTTSPTRSRHG